MFKLCKSAVSCVLYIILLMFFSLKAILDCTSSEFKCRLPVASSNVSNYHILKWSYINTIPIFLLLKSSTKSYHYVKVLPFTNKMSCETVCLHENPRWSSLSHVIFFVLNLCGRSQNMEIALKSDNAYAQHKNHT